MIDMPKRIIALNDGAAELVYQASRGDRAVFVSLPGTPVQPVAEVTRIGVAAPPIIALPNIENYGRFEPYSEEIKATAEAFYRAVSPQPVSYYAQQTGTV